MRLGECARALAAIAMMIGATAQADEPKYGKVETFQPGKKYTCVPTADHKGWDCNEIAAGSAPADKQGGKAPAAETTPLPARTPEPIPAAPASTPAAPPVPVTSSAQPKSSGLPAYLRAGGSSAPAQTAPVAASPTPASRPAPASAAPPEAKPAAGSAAPARVAESRAAPRSPPRSRCARVRSRSRMPAA